MKSAKEIREEIAALHDRVSAIADLATQENRDFTPEETAEIDSIQGIGDRVGQIQALHPALERAEKLEAITKEKAKARASVDLENRIRESEGRPALKVPARAAMQRTKHFKSNEDAYAMGQWAAAALFGNKKARNWCKENGVRNAMSTGDNNKGGFLVPEPLEATIIELREQFGVFRQNTTVMPMADAVALVPKLLGEVSTYFIGENSAITASDMQIAQVKLEAKKLAAFTAVSSELNEDSVISVADMIARSVAYKLAYTEDDCGFNGDGSSTYGNIVGCKSALAAGSVVSAGSGETSFGALKMASFESVVGKIKRYPGIQPKWFIHSTGAWASMNRLADAVGGNTNQTIGDGPMTQRFLGYPVVYSQVLLSDTAANVSTICAYFGDLSMGAYLGDRRGMSMAADSSFYFNQDSIAIRATQRFDINVHDVGTASASGAIIALKLAAS